MHAQLYSCRSRPTLQYSTPDLPSHSLIWPCRGINDSPHRQHDHLGWHYYTGEIDICSATHQLGVDTESFVFAFILPFILPFILRVSTLLHPGPATVRSIESVCLVVCRHALHCHFRHPVGLDRFHIYAVEVLLVASTLLDYAMSPCPPPRCIVQ